MIPGREPMYPGILILGFENPEIGLAYHVIFSNKFFLKNFGQHVQIISVFFTWPFYITQHTFHPNFIFFFIHLVGQQIILFFLGGVVLFYF